MTSPRYHLHFERRSGSTTGHVGGRGDVYEKTALVFSDGDRTIDVALFDEYDRRPFYDAWEYRAVHEATLFHREREDDLCLRVRLHEDVEWNVGGPVVIDRYFTSNDGGATWSEIGRAAGQNAVEEATLLRQQARK